MKSFKLILVIILSLSANSYSQTEWTRSLFVSASGGFYYINSSSIRQTFGTEYIPTVFLGVGLPLGKRGNIYINANYLSLQGTPVAYNFSIVNGQPVLTSYRTPGSVTYTQYQLNFGLLYYWEPKEDLFVGLNIGLLTHHYRSVTSTPTFFNETSNELNFGLHLSVLIEHPIGETHLSWFAESGLHKLFSVDAINQSARTDYSLQAGLRYYFLKRKAEHY